MPYRFANSVFTLAAAALLGCGQAKTTIAGNLSQNPGVSHPPTSTSVLPPPRPSQDANESICPGASLISGFDISDNNPGTNWTTVRTSPSGFAFVKATEGATFVNSLFAADWQGARNTAGIFRGAYHYFHPGEDPTTQANLFLRTVGALQANDLPAMLDWEVSDGVTSAVQIQNATTWLKLVETATGKTPILYIDPAFWNTLGNPVAFERNPLFIAHYNVACPSIPPPWSQWAFWQKGLGAVTGVTTALTDQDEFNGTPTQLNAFATTGELPAALSLKTLIFSGLP